MSSPQPRCRRAADGHVPRPRAVLLENGPVTDEACPRPAAPATRQPAPRTAMPHGASNGRASAPAAAASARLAAVLPQGGCAQLVAVTVPRRAWGPVSVASGSGRCSEVAERHFPGEGGLPRRGGVSPRLALVPEGRLGSLPSSHAHMAVPPVGRTHRRQSQANGRLREKRGDTPPPPPRPCVLVAGP